MPPYRDDPLIHRLAWRMFLFVIALVIGKQPISALTVFFFKTDICMLCGKVAESLFIRNAIDRIVQDFFDSEEGILRPVAGLDSLPDQVFAHAG